MRCSLQNRSWLASEDLWLETFPPGVGGSAADIRGYIWGSKLQEDKELSFRALNAPIVVIWNGWSTDQPLLVKRIPLGHSHKSSRCCHPRWIKMPLLIPLHMKTWDHWNIFRVRFGSVFMFTILGLETLMWTGGSLFPLHLLFFL